MLVFGMDPGYADFGWCCIEVEDDGTHHFLNGGVIRTRNEPHIPRKSEKHLIRMRKIRQRLRAATYDVPSAAINTRAGYACQDAAYYAVEEISYHVKWSGKTYFGLGAAYAIMSSIADEERKPVLQISAKEVKKTLLGTARATKEEVRAHILSLGGYGTMNEVLDRLPASKWEHFSDAVAVAIASIDHDTARFWRGQ